jgi:hypothetical protein
MFTCHMSRCDALLLFSFIRYDPTIGSFAANEVILVKVVRQGHSDSMKWQL